ncbi:MAG: protease modulator HflC [Alphaproteobacteria bacterium]|nr:protease modulator HflC [Alphaproteobacteria bacterium]
MHPTMIKTAIAAVVTLVLMTSSLFIVPQTAQALVLQFGEIKRVVKAPGLHIKVPFIQDLLMFDKRILEFETKPAEFISKNRDTGVDERVVIDAFVRYRIIDPVQFFQSVKNESNLNNRLTSVVLSSMRRVLAAHSLNDLLSTARSDIMRQIKVNVNAQVSAAAGVVARQNSSGPSRNVQGFGVEVVDVRIVRAELPADISQSTYERMRKNFTKEAQRFRAEGEEQATQIRATAERERTELLAEARKTAETTRGQGDALATKTYAEAFGRDPEFFKFYRAMQAYRATLSKDDTTIILSPDDGFLGQFKQ